LKNGRFNDGQHGLIVTPNNLLSIEPNASQEIRVPEIAINSGAAHANPTRASGLFGIKKTANVGGFLQAGQGTGPAPYITLAIAWQT
jgi:hypothetical protein